MKRRSLIRKDVGYQWATTILAFLALAMAPYGVPQAGLEQQQVANERADSPYCSSGTASGSGAIRGLRQHEKMKGVWGVRGYVADSSGRD